MILLDSMNNAKITIDDLALMVKGGFDGMSKSFEEFNEVLNSMSKRLESLEDGQEKILTTLDRKLYRSEFDELERRVIAIESRLGISSTVA